MTLLEVENVVKQFAEHRALDGVSLSVPENSVYGLLGPNGAGKTTLTKLLLRFYEPTSGEILLDGININRFKRDDYQGRSRG